MPENNHQSPDNKHLKLLNRRLLHHTALLCLSLFDGNFAVVLSAKRNKMLVFPQTFAHHQIKNHFLLQQLSFPKHHPTWQIQEDHKLKPQYMSFLVFLLKKQIRSNLHKHSIMELHHLIFYL